MDKRYEQLNYQPCALLIKDIEHPEDCFGNFFCNHQPHEARSRLWELFKSWVFKEAEAGITDDIEEMLLFHEHLKELIEAAFVIHMNNKAEI
ncbi:hypothetical protein EDD80_11817 [Anseongella ginsenosidimutans]|uniref:Uncharacterized protein n=1 Tax=Anseongella ginsenosidimutans TaxID=496056 RepID=A0A4R3KL65_9SPHI|nr:hypothetical protein [Anseongella ginsenosidimutans]QEC51961.1 hypothetical protein FRZ59_06185 [Anseongella ginsenosidimutans]TCS84748.1 hypothetical protein EDD80_11817 [Anseongella ginsenosidimutans]